MRKWTEIEEMDRECGNGKRMRTWRENEEIKRKLREYEEIERKWTENEDCLLYTSPSPRDRTRSRMPSSA